jgi:hypothetical protein
MAAPNEIDFRVCRHPQQPIDPALVRPVRVNFNPRVATLQDLMIIPGGTVPSLCRLKQAAVADGHWYSSKKPGLTVTSSAIRSRTSTPRRNSLSRSHSLSPSISSTGGARPGLPLPGRHG